LPDIDASFSATLVEYSTNGIRQGGNPSDPLHVSEVADERDIESAAMLAKSEELKAPFEG
jgi:hypothetical protein